MEPTLAKLNGAFNAHYCELLKLQKDLYENLCRYSFDLSKREITDAIIERMNAFWYFGVNNNKEVLHRGVNPIAADFFTETVLLFLKAYFESKYADKVQVCSEVRLWGETDNSKSYILPDICMRKKTGEVMAVLELKVNEGWKSQTMRKHLSDRKAKIKELYPNSFFCVIAFFDFDKDGLIKKDLENNYIALEDFRPLPDLPKLRKDTVESLMVKIEENILLFDEREAEKK